MCLVWGTYVPCKPSFSDASMIQSKIATVTMQRILVDTRSSMDIISAIGRE